MRTATITFHAPNNNGSFYQAYALQKVLTNTLGVENEIIDYQSEKQIYQYSVFRPIHSIRDIAKNYQNNPKFIKVADKKQNVPKITQYAFRTNHKYKFNDLVKLIEVYNIKSALIFSNTKKGVDFVFKNLKKQGYSTEALHGDMTQKVRDKVMNKFRNGNVSFLVATDVAARGLDISNLEFIINYDVPQNYDAYVHRIGRTARAGKRGYAFTLVSKEDATNFKNISKAKITIKKLPSDKELEEIRIKQVLDEVKVSVKKEDLDKYLKAIKNSSAADITSEEIAAALLKKIREN